LFEDGRLIRPDSISQGSSTRSQHTGTMKIADCCLMFPLKLQDFVEQRKRDFSKRISGLRIQQP
jgi:hypothetical protein